MKIKDIIPNPNNPRTAEPLKMEKLMNSILDFPKMMTLRPMVLDENNVVLGGNMRLRTIKKIKTNAKKDQTIFAKYPDVRKLILAGEIPDEWVKSASELDDDEKRRFIIADNVGFGEWDWELLESDWGAEQLEKWGLELEFGDDDEIEADAVDDEFDDKEISHSDVFKGDLIEFVCDDGRVHRLMCGDSTNVDDVEKLRDGVEIDVVFTDPPYGMKLNTNYKRGTSGIEYNGVSDENRGNYHAVIGDGDDFKRELIDTIFTINCKECFIWGADYFAELIPKRNDGCWIVWDKRKGLEHVEFTLSSFELCWSKNKHKREICRTRWFGIHGMETQDTKQRVHPTQKPIELCNWFFKKYSKENDKIIDLYLGSGSTMVAAHQLNRICFGMELSENYCQTIINRMMQLDDKIKVNINGVEYVKKEEIEA